MTGHDWARGSTRDDEEKPEAPHSPPWKPASAASDDEEEEVDEDVEEEEEEEHDGARNGAPQKEPDEALVTPESWEPSSSTDRPHRLSAGQQLSAGGEEAKSWSRWLSEGLRGLSGRGGGAKGHVAPAASALAAASSSAMSSKVRDL